LSHIVISLINIVCGTAGSCNKTLIDSLWHHIGNEESQVLHNLIQRRQKLMKQSTVVMQLSRVVNKY